MGLPVAAAVAFIAVAIALSLYQLFTAGVRPVGLFYQRGFHLAAVEVLAFLLFPCPGRDKNGLRLVTAWVLDGALIAVSIATSLYLTINLDSIVGRAGIPSGWDIAMGAAAVVALLEAGRRADLNLIDLDALTLHVPEITHDLPTGAPRVVQRVDGFRATVVRGQVTFRDGMETGAHPGRLIRA